MKIEELKNARLILCDIDGTLYNWSRVLSPKTLEVIQELHQRGYEFGIASGRPYEELIHYAKEWKLGFPCDVIIGQNGAEVWNIQTNELKEYYKLSTDTLHEICDVMQQFECNPMMYSHQKLLCIKKDAMIEKSARTSNREIEVGDDISCMYQEPNVKIMFRMKEEELEKVEAYVKEHPSLDYVGLKTQSTLFEFMDPRLSKGYGIHELCKYVDYTEEDIVAFGDTTNDNSMLEVAGWGVCLKNGTEDTKAIADDITQENCEDDGFANYVEHYIF